ncbi:HpcH/HpaI aldolase/citrate lyase family protein [Nocardioides hwasunensis]|uniref:CoA ester lyase n=1 Tax=Nocardioides hwasunensis TaxID=397258 RepID=A0ABR8MH49_9ACTN|nr:CoA ester lyase [Nocardioides hwasunensis]MBD3915401.1 CoA ester lyase [Nocardioides hwasunensis]
MNDRPRGAPDLVALYVPGNRPALFEKALVGPDVVILDLEDAVPLAAKDDARRAVRSWVDGLDQASRARISVRVNAVGTPQHSQDLAAVADLGGLHSVRVPKVESREDVAAVSAVVGDLPVHALLETARGIEAAATVAASPGVGALAIGEADLRSDLGVTAEDGLAWARSRVVVAARAAGLPAPMMSAWTDLEDDQGLLASCRAGRGMGFLGRTAVHPRQVPTIRAGFAPSEEEVAHARALLRHLGDDHDERGIAVTESGHMVDRAMVRNAEQVLALHDASR